MTQKQFANLPVGKACNCTEVYYCESCRVAHDRTGERGDGSGRYFVDCELCGATLSDAAHMDVCRDDSDIIDLIDSAKTEWAEAHPECDESTSEITDEEINTALDLPPGGAPDLAARLSGWSDDKISQAVADGMDNWWNRAEVRFELVTDYNAPPPADAFQEAGLARLEEISREIAASESSSVATEWSNAAWECDSECCDEAIRAARAGKMVLVAEDEDGYYFAYGK